MNTLNEVYSSLNITKIFSYAGETTLSSVGGLSEIKFKTNSDLMWCFFPMIVLYNSNGKILNFDDEAYNYFLINMRDLTGNNDFSDNLMTISQFNLARLSKQYDGYIMNSNTNFVISFTGQNLPAGAINLNYTAKAFFIGYNLGYGNNYKEIKSRVNMLYPFSQTLNLSLSGVGANTTAQNNRIRTTQNGQFIHTIACDVRDNLGKIISPTDLQNILFLNLKDDSGNIILNNIPLFALNLIAKAERFKGVFLKPESDYYIEIFAENNSNITSQTLDINTISGNFAIGEQISGGTSSETADIVDIVTNGATGYLVINNASGNFTNTETITGAVSGATADVDGSNNASPMKYPLTINIGFYGNILKQFGRQ